MKLLVVCLPAVVALSSSVLQASGSTSAVQEVQAPVDRSQAAPPESTGPAGPASTEDKPATEGDETASPEAQADTAAAESRTDRRTELNLLGQTDTQSGESRRNENVQFNLIDNNVLKELNKRLGTTATLTGEFEPDRNYFGSEYGNSPPDPLHLVPADRRAIHGQGYWAHLNSVFSARSFFQVGEVQPAHENDYGFSVSTPAWSGANLSLEGGQQKIRGSVNGNVLVPRPDERTPLTNDPGKRALVESFLGAYPDELPNRTDINERALNTNAPQVIDNDTVGARLDQMLGPKDRLALRHLFTSQSVDAFQFVTGRNPDTETRAHNARITWTRQWSSASTTDISVGFDRIASRLVPEENWPGPTVITTSLTTIGPLWVIPIDRAQNRFRYAAQYRQIRNRHNWSLGLEIVRQQINGWESDAHRGEIQFVDDFGRDAITNLRMGEPSLYYISLGDVHRGFRNWQMQFFIGDRWRVADSLTVNYGLQYRPVTRPYEVNGLNTFPYDSDLNNMAPHLGLAYQLADGWGVLRAAFGLHYGEIFPATFQQIRNNPPGNREILIPAADLLNPLAGLSDENLLATPYRLSPDLVTPYSQQYSFSWEFQPASYLTLQMGYVGSRSPKLFHMWPTNRARPASDPVLQTTSTIHERRPDPNLSAVYDILNASRGYFDAAKVTAVVRAWNGLSMDASYWFSKALDLGASYTNTAAALDSIAASPSEFEVHKEMKGRSDFDQPHALLWRLFYELPSLPTQAGWLQSIFKDWSVFTVTLLKSGTPFGVDSGGDSPGFGNVDGIWADRPHLLDPSVLGRTVGHPDTSAQLLPRSAFAFMNPLETRGNLGRNVFRKGPIHNVNVALSRRWTFRAEKVLSFRAESINFLNTPQFAEPGSSLASRNFGQITNTLNDGRTVRFLLSFNF